MTPRALRPWSWSWLHKWSSLAGTVFLLVLCLTGLPLVFHHQIGQWLGTEPPRLVAVELAAGARDPRLLGDGGWDWPAWIGLGAPCAVAVWFGLRDRPPRWLERDRSSCARQPDDVRPSRARCACDARPVEVRRSRRQSVISERSWNTSALRSAASAPGWFTSWKSGSSVSHFCTWLR